ncbi:MAG: SIMPL domain-containing protein, partial [Salegentibacter sp.]
MKYISAIIFSVAIVVAAYLLGESYVSRANPDGVISVTGSGSENFTSDLIVWEGRFTRVNPNLEQAYKELNRDKEVVKNYLTEKGISPENFIFNSVQTNEQRENQYQNGNYVGSTFKAYELVQTIKIESK